jgi:hypothetical protein
VSRSDAIAVGSSPADTSRPAERRWQRSDWGWLLILLVVVTLTWCTHHRKWTRADWQTPVEYVGARTWDMTFAGDALWGMAATKARADGEMSFFDKSPNSLGAPFGANWNEWLTVEEGVNGWWALLVWAFGLFVGSNLVLLSAHLLAAASFYVVCRYLGYDPMLSAAGGALYALSRYAFWRSLANLSLTFYWHLPLALLVLWWCLQDTRLTRKQLLVSGVVAALSAAHSAYYTGIFLQFLFWAAVFRLLRTGSWRAILLPTSIVAVVIGTLVLMNVDTIFSKIVSGHHPGTLHRFYSDLELYALKPVELLLPRSHSLEALQDWTHEVYFNRTMFRGEQGSAYTGAAGAVALVILVIVVASAIAKGNIRAVPVHFWGVALVTLFSVVGGLNGLVGLSGLWLFRASNRYSIVISTILLLFLVKYLTALSRGWHRAAVAALAVALAAAGIYDQVPPRYKQRQLAARAAVAEETEFVSAIEARVPENAMMFQLPVFPFPEGLLEGPMIGSMEDYEPFRPYLHSSILRFSYGDMKGRYENQWQKEAEQLGLRQLVRLLETYGFSAVLINRDAYPDKARPLLQELAHVGKSRIIARSSGWFCVALNPKKDPSLPPVFRHGWYPLEVDIPRTRRWSSGNSLLTLYNSGADPKTVHLSFELQSIGSRRVSIVHGDKILHEAEISAGDPPIDVSLTVSLAPGANNFTFTSDKPGEVPGTTDLRTLAFSLIDFRVE